MKHGLARAMALSLAIFVPQAAGAGWSIEIVDATGDVGLHTSLAFDNLGYPCVSYHDETNGTLKVACKMGDVWIDETVPDPETPVGDYSSLAIETTDGTMHIAYRRGWTSLSVLKYAKRTGSEWQIETVDNQSNGVGHHISLALDASGFPHISHSKWFGNDTVKYAGWTGSSWENQTVYKAGQRLATFKTRASRSMAATSRSSPFTGLDLGGDVFLARRTGGGKWKSASTGSGPDRGETVSQVIDGATHHVVYATSDYFLPPYLLRYATWSDQNGMVCPSAISNRRRGCRGDCSTPLPWPSPTTETCI